MAPWRIPSSQQGGIGGSQVGEGPYGPDPDQSTASSTALRNVQAAVQRHLDLCNRLELSHFTSTFLHEISLSISAKELVSALGVGNYGEKYHFLLTMIYYLR
jgi:hypothetical protein